MIGIVILNYNTWNQTMECLKSIVDSKILYEYRIYLIDNKSTAKMPGECQKIIEENEIVFLEAEQNSGYASGNNIGIRKALADMCEVILISNNDIVYREGVAERLYEYLQSDKDIGIVAPKIMLPDGKIQECNLGCKMSLSGKYLYILRKTWFRVLTEKFVREFKVDIEHTKIPAKVYGVSGCFFMISAACLSEIGLLDETTFLYEEENIIGCKMEKAGLDTYLVPDVTVIHNHGQSTKYAQAFAYSCMAESEIYYCKRYLHAKNYHLIGLYLIRLGVYLVRCIKNKDYRINFKKFCEKTFKQFKIRR